LVIVREVLGFFTMPRPLDDTQALVVVVGGSVIASAILLMLWFFPKSIARGLLPAAADTPTQTMSYQMWFSLGTALLGLWFVASSITPILRNLSVMYVLRPELITAEDLRSLRVGLFYHVAEMVLGLCLLFGATGISKLLWRIRHAGAD
jgi:hypothetical protein